MLRAAWATYGPHNRCSPVTIADNVSSRFCRSKRPWGANRLVVVVSGPVRGVLSSGPLPGSRWVTIHLCGPPGGIGRAAQPPIRPCSGWGLPIRPGRPETLVRSYRTVSPLPVPCRFRSGHRRSVLCCPNPSGRPDLALASTLPDGAPTFLSDHIASPRPPGLLTTAAQPSRTGLQGMPDPPTDRAPPKETPRGGDSEQRAQIHPAPDPLCGSRGNRPPRWPRVGL